MRCIRCDGPLDGVTRRQCPACGQPFNPGDPETYEHDTPKVSKRREKRASAQPQSVDAGDGARNATRTRRTSDRSEGKLDSFWLWAALAGFVYIVIAAVTMALLGDAAASEGRSIEWSFSRLIWLVVRFPLLLVMPSTTMLGIWGRLLINAVFWGFTAGWARQAYLEKLKGKTLHDTSDE